MPAEYSARVLWEKSAADTRNPGTEEHAIATVKHYRSLVPLAQEARKPIFKLAPADGAHRQPRDGRARRVWRL